MRVLLFASFVACSRYGDTSGAVCTCHPSENELYETEDHGNVVQQSSKDLLWSLRNRTHRLSAPTLNDRSRQRFAERIDGEIRDRTKVLCRPCDWVTETIPITELYRMDLLDQAVDAGCMRLIMKDGWVAYGDAYPVECRQ